MVVLLLMVGRPGPARAQPLDVSVTVDALRLATLAGKIDDAVVLYTPDAIAVTPFGAFTGPVALRDFYEQFLRTNPQLSVTFSERQVALTTEVHRSFVSSESIRAAGVNRIVFMETIVTTKGKIVSATILLDLTDEQTVRFAAALGGG